MADNVGLTGHSTSLLTAYDQQPDKITSRSAEMLVTFTIPNKGTDIPNKGIKSHVLPLYRNFPGLRYNLPFIGLLQLGRRGLYDGSRTAHKKYCTKKQLQ